MGATFEEGKDQVARLVAHFRANNDRYLAPAYKETWARQEFIDPFFIALGWDVRNERRVAPQYREVITEESLDVEGHRKAPDYVFRVGQTNEFFAEAKKPGVAIKSDPAPAYQLRRYAWSAKLPFSILTDFHELAVYDCRRRPRDSDNAGIGRTHYFAYEEYADRFREIWERFSREAVWGGSFDRFAQSDKGKRGTGEVDAEFLKEIEGWRDVLARNIALRNPRLTIDELNDAVQRTIDRIIFLRMAEDRGMEPYEQLRALAQGKDIYANLVHELYRKADGKYNSGLFDFVKDTLTPRLAVDDKVLKPIVASLYFPQSPYEFSVLPAEILGNVYEQFLGKVIRLTAGHQAKVEDKPEVKKAGGVYYTPSYIVEYIVKNTVGKMLGEPGSGSGEPEKAKGDEENEWRKGAERNPELPRSGGLAGSDGLGRSGLPNDSGIPPVREIRLDRPGPSGSRIRAVKHRRGARETAPSGLPSFPVRGQGLAGRTGDPDRDRFQAELPDTAATDRDSAALPEGGASSERSDPLSSRRPIPAPRPPDPRPLSPGPRPLSPKDLTGFRVLDMACGSGSFLLGAYQYLLDHYLRWYVDHKPEKETKAVWNHRGEWRLTTAERKRILLAHVFGVDIDRQAVEVTKLSLLLKVLEGETEQTLGEQRQQLTFWRDRALPDLDQNIKCGNSLISPDYFTGDLVPDADELRRIRPFDWNAEFPDAMKAGGFDCVIGNPPWGAGYSEGEKEYFRNAFQGVHVRTPESFNYFISAARERTGSEGVVGFIIPSSFLTQYEFWKTRKILVESASIHRVCNLGDGVFPRITAPCCVVIFATKQTEGRARYIDLRKTDRTELASQLLQECGSVDAAGIGLESDSFLLLVRPGLHVIQKCFVWSPLRDVAEDVATGISSGLDMAYVYEPAEAKRLGLESDLLRKLVVGGEIHRYVITPRSGKKIIYITAETNIEKYPNCRAALRPYKDRLRKRREAANGQIPWFALNWPRRKKLFDQPKILIRQTSDHILAAFDSERWYCLKSAIIVQIMDEVRLSYPYLLGLLNSRLMRFLYDDLVGEESRVFPEVKPVQLFKLPIRTINFTDPSDDARHDRMVALVEQMLELHKRLHDAKTAPADRELYQRQIDATDREIDRLVYDLYGLTEEEIRIVEAEQ